MRASGLFALQLWLGLGLAAFNVRESFAWIDKSCDGLDSRLNKAGDDYTAMVNAAYNSLGPELAKNKLQDLTLSAYLGTHDTEGSLIKLKYGKLKKYGAGEKNPFSLYCDGSAFEWVTTYQEGDQKGEELPKEKFSKGGAWHTKEGRYNPDEGPLYMSGSPETDLRSDFCKNAEGKEVQGVSARGGKHIVLCPDAFEDFVKHEIDPHATPAIGTNLDDMTSLGSVLLHEMTHCVLSTQDIQYRAVGCLIIGKFSTKAQQNAESWMYYAMATLLKKRAWVMGVAQSTTDYGPKGKLHARRREPVVPSVTIAARKDKGTYVIETAAAETAKPTNVSHRKIASIIQSLMDKQSKSHHSSSTTHHTSSGAHSSTATGTHSSTGSGAHTSSTGTHHGKSTLATSTKSEHHHTSAGHASKTAKAEHHSSKHGAKSKPTAAAGHHIGKGKGHGSPKSHGRGGGRA